MLAKRKYLLIIAAVLAALVVLSAIWIKIPLCARLCFSARLYAMSCLAGPEAQDYLTEDGYSLVLQNQESLAFLAETAWNADTEDVTGCCLATWPAPTYYAGSWEIGGNGCLIHDHFNRIYIFYPSSNAIEMKFAKFLSVS